MTGSQSRRAEAYARRRAVEDVGIVLAALGLLVLEFEGVPLPTILLGLLGLYGAACVVAGVRWWLRRRRTP